MSAVSGTQPDNPREWQAVFVGTPDRNCVVGSTAEHFPPARIDGYRLKSANEATRVATYGPVGGDGVETGAGSAAPGLTGSLLGASDSGSGQDDSGDLSGSSTWEQVEALAAILEPEAFDPDQPALDEWREDTRGRARAHAAKVITEGWRRVSVDDDTVERVAAAIADADAGSWEDIQSGIRLGSKWAPKAADYYRSLARAAVQALRDGNSQSTPSSSKAGSSALRDGGQ